MKSRERLRNQWTITIPPHFQKWHTKIVIFLAYCTQNSRVWAEEKFLCFFRSNAKLRLESYKRTSGEPSWRKLPWNPILSFDQWDAERIRKFTSIEGTRFYWGVTWREHRSPLQKKMSNLSIFLFLFFSLFGFPFLLFPCPREKRAVLFFFPENKKMHFITREKLKNYQKNR